MVRVQIRLTEDQVRALRRLADSRGVSMAAAIREILDEALTSARAARIARARAVIGRFVSGQVDVAREHDRELERAFDG